MVEVHAFSGKCVILNLFQSEVCLIVIFNFSCFALQALSKALTDLRTDMVTQAQDSVRAHADDASQEQNIQRLIDQHTKLLNEQIEDYQSMTDRQKKELKKRKENEHTLQSELEDVREELCM